MDYARVNNSLQRSSCVLRSNKLSFSCETSINIHPRSTHNIKKRQERNHICVYEGNVARLLLVNAINSVQKQPQRSTEFFLLLFKQFGNSHDRQERVLATLKCTPPRISAAQLHTLNVFDRVQCLCTNRSLLSICARKSVLSGGN